MKRCALLEVYFYVFTAARSSNLIHKCQVFCVIHTEMGFMFSLLPCQAKTHVCDIEQRLQGVIKSRNKVLGLPLSIEGHVHYLIQEATDDKLLCQMYLGWGPYL